LGVATFTKDITVTVQMRTTFVEMHLLNDTPFLNNATFIGMERSGARVRQRGKEKEFIKRERQCLSRCSSTTHPSKLLRNFQLPAS
jgi:hypothetical protein